MENPIHAAPATSRGGVPAPLDLGELPPAVIPAPMRADPDTNAAGSLQGTDADNRSVGAGEGSGNSGGMLAGDKIELAGDA